MNFLAHFYLDRSHPSSIFAIGAATPDLLSIFNPVLRIKAHHLKNIDPAQQTETDRDLAEGIHRHFVADKVFHSSSLFIGETKVISELLKDMVPGMEVPRKYFIAHILLELILDKVLIQEFPDLPGAYYAHYSSMNPFEGIRMATEKISGEGLPNYDGFLQKFLENRYLNYYSDFRHISYVMKRILRRVKIEENAFLDLPEFYNLMETYSERLKYLYPVFFQEIEDYALSQEKKPDFPSTNTPPL